MNKHRVKELVLIDLLETMRKNQSEKRRYKVTKDNVGRRVLLMNLAMLALCLFLFGGMMIGVPLSEVPGMASQMLFMLVTMGSAQSFIIIYNLLYEDKNMAQSLALPFKKSELFVSKIIAVLLSVGAFFAPMAIVIGNFGRLAGASPLFYVPFALLSTVGLTTVGLGLITVFLQYVTQTQLFKRHERLIMGLSYMLIFAVIFTVSYRSGSGVGEQVEQALESGQTVVDQTPLYPFISFLYVFLPGRRLAGWVGVGLTTAVLVAVVAAVIYRVIPASFAEKEPVVTKRRKTRRTKDGRRRYSGLNRTLIKYQLSQMEDASFMMQLLFSKAYLPIIFAMPLILSGVRVDYSFIGTLGAEWGIYLLLGALAAYMTLGAGGPAGMAMSLDRENFTYLKTLPLPFADYLKKKFYFAWFMEWALGALVFGVIGIFLRPPLLQALIGLIGYTAMTYILSLRYYMRDFRLLELNWSNVTELATRGSGPVIQMLLLMLVMFIAAMGTVFLFIWTLMQPTWVQWTVSLVIFGLLTAGVIGITLRARHKFWPHVLDDASMQLEADEEETLEADFDPEEQDDKDLSYPPRKLDWRDGLWLLATSNLGLQMIAGFVISYVMIRKGMFDLSGNMFELIVVGTTIASLPAMLLVIYWRQLPLINRQRVPRKEWKLLPGMTGKDWKFLLWYIPVSYALYIAGQVLVDHFLGEAPVVNQEAIEELAGNTPLILIFLMVVVVAPIVEEWLFRGFIMFYRGGRPGWISTLVSATAFGLMHTPTNLQSAYTYIGMGLIFAYAVKKTGKVEAGIFYHFLNNAVAFIGLVLQVQGYI